MFRILEELGLSILIPPSPPSPPLFVWSFLLLLAPRDEAGATRAAAAPAVPLAYQECPHGAGRILPLLCKRLVREEADVRSDDEVRDISDPRLPPGSGSEGYSQS